MTHEAELPFDALLEHAPFLRRLARALMRDEASAQDLVQDTWLRALRRPPRDGGGARGWLASIAQRRARDARKLEAHRTEREELAARPEREPPPSELEERVDLARKVLDAVQSLREPYREVIWLRYYEDLAPREIARRLGVPIETVTTRLRRGKELLRTKLGERREWLPAMASLAALRPEGAALLGGTLGAPAWIGAALLVTVALALTFAGARDRSPRFAPAVPALAVQDGTVAAGSVDARAASPHDAAAPNAASSLRASSSERTSAAPAIDALDESAATLLCGSVRWENGESLGTAAIGVVRAAAGAAVGELVDFADGFEAPSPFELEVPGGGAVLLVAAAPGVPVITRVLTLPPEGRVEVELVGRSTGTCFEGRVVDERGAPLAGVQLFARDRELGGGTGICFVSCSEHSSVTHRGATRKGNTALRLGRFELFDRDGEFQHASAEADTDEDGRFAISGLGAGEYQVEVVTRRMNGLDDAVGIHWRHGVRPVAVRVPDSAALIVWSERVVLLEVRDEDGPLDGVVASLGQYASVLEHHTEGTPRHEWPFEICLPSSGRVAIAFDPIDDPGLHFLRTSHAPALVRLASCAAEADGWLAVRMPQSDAVSSLRLRLDCGSAPPPMRASARLDGRTGPDGSRLGTVQREQPVVSNEVHLDDLPPGEYALELAVLDGAPFLNLERIVELGVGETTLDLRLELGAALEIVLEHDVDPLSTSFMARDGEGRHRELDPLGAHPKPGEPARLHPPLPAGDWTLVVERKGRIAWERNVRVVAGEIARIAVSLPPE